MTQLVLATAGAAIGSLFGPVGVQVGWAVGSLVGASLGPGVQGPRLSDTKVQISSYGAMLPISYGGERHAGNVIWSTDLIESEETSGGKGGPEVTTYTYSVSCAVAIGEGPIQSVRKIWADAKLVYDASEDADDATRAASGDFAQYFVYYKGDETQLPDPTIEAIEGVGNVEAYRGTAYIVFTDLPLAPYGNRVPSFTFETSNFPTDTTPPADSTIYEALKIYPWELSEFKAVHSTGDTQYTVTRNSAVRYSGTDLAAAIAASQANPTSGWPQEAYADKVIGFYNSASGGTLMSRFTGGAAVGDDAQTCTYAVAYQYPTALAQSAGSPYPGAGFGAVQPGDSIRAAGGSIGDGQWWLSKFATNYVYNVVSETPTPPTLPQYVNDGYFYEVGFVPYGFLYGARIVPIVAQRVPAPPPDSVSCGPGDPCALGIAEVPGNTNYCIACDGTVSAKTTTTWTVATGTFRQLAAVEYRSGVLWQNGLGPVVPSTDPRYGDSAFWAAARTAAIAAGTLQATATSPVDVTQVAVGTVSTFAENSTPPGETTLSAVVTDICERAGLTASQIDVTALTDTVLGYCLTRQAPARAALEPLRQAFFFDAVENGTKIQFVKRGGASVATITADDLGASEGEPTSGGLVVPVRAQEEDLPAEINVAYSCREADYQVGTQQSKRLTTGSQQVIGAEMSIVLTDEKAAQVADVLMYDAWAGRSTRKFRTTRKWSKLLPTDVVTVNDGEFTYTGRLVDENQQGPVIEWTLRDEEAAAYAPASVGSITSGGGSVVRFDGPMKVVLLDVPLLRDEDDGAAVLLACAGYRSSFRGGRVFRSLDAGATFAGLIDVNRQATIGFAETVLATYAGGNTVDEVNSVDVRLHSGTLSTITRAQLLNGGNAAVLGDEVLYFRRAQLVSGTTYRLTGLLRGRRGTEAAMATHAAGEAFVLLSTTNIYRAELDVSDVDLASILRGVTFGSTIDDALDVDFTYSAANLKPLAPVRLAAWPSGGGNYTARWTRRGRIAPAWRNGSNVPIGEESESYLVEVLSGSTVLRSSTVSSPAVTITAAAGNVLRVRQLSALVGPGFPSQITLS